MSSFGVDPDRVHHAAEELRALVQDLDGAGRQVADALERVGTGAPDPGLRGAAGDAARRWSGALADLGVAGDVLAGATRVAAEGYSLVQWLSTARLRPVPGMHR